MSHPQKAMFPKTNWMSVGMATLAWGINSSQNIRPKKTAKHFFLFGKYSNFATAKRQKNEIKEVLAKMGIHLGMETPGWPPENIEELIRRCDEPF